MLRALVVGMLAVTLAACSKHEDDAAVPATAAAGKVLEATGKVTATRGGTTRALATNAEVFRDDLVDTADGSVVIELFHNGARWTLESQTKVQVSESVAWGLDKQQAAKTVEHATSSAGRHADHSAADTKESAGVATETKPNAPQPEAAAVVATEDKPNTQPAAAAAPQTPQKDPPKPVRRPDPAPPPPPPGNTAECDEVACTMDPSAACCSRMRRKAGDRSPGAGELPEHLDQTAVREGVMKVKQRVGQCVEKFPAKGTVKTKVVVDGSGRVTVVVIEETPDAALGRCVAAVLKSATFTKSRDGITFRFPFVF
ncbi:MAG: hypothetical protein ABI867_23960 [Kofleriaceae bacterium]